MSDYIVDIDEGNAQRHLIEESMRRPVLVDFWADWCEPCKALLPILEKLASEYQGRFLLARVNADRQQDIAQQLGVRSLPTVMLIREGQPVDGFVGAQPEGEVRKLLDKHLPKPWDDLLREAQELLAAGEAAQALPMLRRAWEESGRRRDICLALARALLDEKRLDEAQKVLDAVRPADRDADWRRLESRLDSLREAARSPRIESLERQVAAAPGDFDLQRQLAAQYREAGMYREAMDTLLGILRADREDAGPGARKALLDIIATLGKGDPLAAEYQRKLFGLLH